MFAYFPFDAFSYPEVMTELGTNMGQIHTGDDHDRAVRLFPAIQEVFQCIQYMIILFNILRMSALFNQWDERTA